MFLSIHQSCSSQSPALLFEILRGKYGQFVNPVSAHHDTSNDVDHPDQELINRSPPLLDCERQRLNIVLEENARNLEVGHGAGRFGDGVLIREQGAPGCVGCVLRRDYGEEILELEEVWFDIISL